MASKFKFRLQKVLEFRQSVEEQAKRAFLEAQSRRVAAQQELSLIWVEHERLMKYPCNTLDERRTLETALDAQQDLAFDQQIVIQVLEGEEEQLREAWVLAKKEAEAMVKLREAQLEDWQLEQNRLEQIELDEWAVMRRAQ